MRTRILFAAIAAASMLTAPVLANGSAAKLSVLGSDARVGQTMANASNQEEGSDSGIFIAVGAAAAVALAIVLISGGDDEDDLPTSP